MSLPALFDAAICVLAVMVVFTLLATAINEAIADNLRNLRGKTLAQVIHNLLERERERATVSGQKVSPAPDLVKAFYDRPEIKSLMRPRSLSASITEGRRRPSAIEPRQAALSVLAVLLDPDEMAKLEARASKERDDYRALLEQSLTALPIGELNRQMALRGVAELSALIESEMAKFRTTLDRRRIALEAEYAELIARAQGWYLRSTRKMLFVIGLVLAAGSNIDLLGYTEQLMAEESLPARTEVAKALIEDLEEKGLAGSSDPDQTAAQTAYDAAVASLGKLEVPLGWTCQPPRDGEALIPLSNHACGTAPGVKGYHWPSVPQAIGWVLIAFGVTLGAQFWFDLFKKIVDLRTAGSTVTPKPTS
ncbi:hypothetical protein AYJ57_16795 [Salipiger sp. CCB-MM3]|uniref:hypothetical protein n=1 Tax=Salipiger sp. CCB-MM3 TaxID=1792508 RepID=UPI00080AB9B7|nr:hypothetical protein [Salipiger sp. CCB-MM3]ANT62092.1 hypothetical protein AYJ57_16795 [Salipiger sp. CCB-MM3]